MYARTSKSTSTRIITSIITSILGNGELRIRGSPAIDGAPAIVRAVFSRRKSEQNPKPDVVIYLNSFIILSECVCHVQVAVVTGGSRGIGLMCAKALIENGARVWIVSRKAPVVDAVCAALNGLPTATGTAVPCAGTQPNISLSAPAEIKRA